ncbi:hypothetical protein D3C75_1115130 [compost metagenome]
MLFFAVIGSGAFQRGSNHIPAGPAAADDIQRAELARNRKGFTIGGRQGANQTDVSTDGSKCAENCQRLKPVQEMRNGLFVNVQAVRDEDQIQLALLCLLYPLFV